MRILIVEDNPGDVQLVRGMLKEGAGEFTLYVAERLSAGLEVLSSQEGVEVVLLDLGLPDSRGLETLIRVQEGFPRLPVLIMTSIADESLAVQAIRLGAQDYLVKGQLDGGLLRHALAYAGERKQVGELIRGQAGLLDFSHDAIFTWEIGGGILYWNRGAQELYGFGLSEVIGRNPHELVRTSPASAGELHQQLKRDRQWEGELAHTTRDGRLIIVDSRMVVMQGQGGKQLVLETNRDITERKKAELLKDEFIGMVSHELKTPLTVLIGALSTAQVEGVTADQTRLLMQDAVDSAESLNSIVDNLLELSRHQARRLDLQCQWSDLAQVAREAVRKVQGRAGGHRLRLELPPEMPAVNADPLRIERIVVNLLDNALKYSPPGSEVRVFARQENDQLLLGVSDQGRGISREDQARLFRSFQRLDPSIKGIGLGLRVCRILAEAHGGRIWVDSEPGKGSTFFFALPAPPGARRQP